MATFKKISMKENEQETLAQLFADIVAEIHDNVGFILILRSKNESKRKA